MFLEGNIKDVVLYIYFFFICLLLLLFFEVELLDYFLKAHFIIFLSFVGFFLANCRIFSLNFRGVFFF